MASGPSLQDTPITRRGVPVTRILVGGGGSAGRPDPLVAADAEVLVVVQEADPLHPSQLACKLIGPLSRCQLVVFDGPRMVLRQRARPHAEISNVLAKT